MATTTNLGKVHVFSTEALYNQYKSLISDNDLALLKDDSAAIVAANLAENGYVKFANGLIVQWGKNQESPITFPIAFAKAVYTITPVLQSPNDGGNMSKNRLCATNISVSGFSIVYPQDTYNWIAIGM